jgi:hypothetical protein
MGVDSYWHFCICNKKISHSDTQFSGLTGKLRLMRLIAITELTSNRNPVLFSFKFKELSYHCVTVVAHSK